MSSFEEINYERERLRCRRWANICLVTGIINVVMAVGNLIGLLNKGASNAEVKEPGTATDRRPHPEVNHLQRPRK